MDVIAPAGAADGSLGQSEGRRSRATPQVAVPEINLRPGRGAGTPAGQQSCVPAEATRKIKAAFPKARVFMVSQWASPGLREAARIAGAENYISKADLLPFRDLLKAGRPKP